MRTFINILKSLFNRCDKKIILSNIIKTILGGISEKRI